MRPLALLCTLAAVLAVLPALAGAQDPEVTLSRSYAAIGEPIVLTVVLETSADGVVELDPAAESWGPVRVIRVLSQTALVLETGLHHRIEVLIAPFAPGTIAFRPAVTVTTNAGSSPVALPALTLEVPSSLAPGEPLTLSPLRPPAPIGGAQSPLFWPAVVLGTLAAVALATATLVLGLRWWRNRPAAPAPAPPPAPVDVFASAAALLEPDAAGAYRAISTAVRNVLGERYEFPAQSLTTAELETRMAAAGVDGWEERMARELLRECDAVVYAGYRPALERRVADLRIAREIVGGTG